MTSHRLSCTSDRSVTFKQTIKCTVRWPLQHAVLPYILTLQLADGFPKSPSAKLWSLVAYITAMPRHGEWKQIMVQFTAFLPRDATIHCRKYVCQSVRPSRSGIVSKRLNKSSEFFHQSIGDCRNEYSDTSDHRHWETGWNVLTTSSDRLVVVTSQVRSYFFVRWQRLRARQRDRQTRPNIIITSPCIYAQYIVQ